MSVDNAEWLRTILGEVDKRQRRWIREGIITAVRKKDKAVRVLLLPEKSKTGWLRGYYLNSFGSGQMPAMNSSVIVLFVEGHPDGGIILAGGFNEDPTTPKDDDEYAIIDKWGNQVIMNSDGVKIKSSTKIVLDSDIELGEGATNGLLMETFYDAILNHTHIDPLSTNTGTVTPGTLLKVGHVTTKAKGK